MPNCAKDLSIFSLLCLLTCTLISCSFYFIRLPKLNLQNAILYPINATIVEMTYEPDWKCSRDRPIIVCTAGEYNFYLTFQYTPDCLAVENCGTQKYKMFWSQTNSLAKDQHQKYKIGQIMELTLNICVHSPLLQSDIDICEDYALSDKLYKHNINTNFMYVSSIILFVFAGISGVICTVCNLYLLVGYFKAHPISFKLNKFKLNKPINRQIVHETHDALGRCPSYRDPSRSDLPPSYEEVIHETNINRV